jgi:transcriptional regulator with XRE-family HTH domain
MEKSIYTRDYALVLRLLKEARKRAGMTQVEFAKRLQQSQSFVSKIERGDRRLDIVQLRTICHIFGLTLPDFVELLETALRERK